LLAPADSGQAEQVLLNFIHRERISIGTFASIAKLKLHSSRLRRLATPICSVFCVIAFGLCLHVTRADDVAASYAGISIDGSPQIFAIMCALDVAGFDGAGPTPSDLPAQAALRRDLAQLNGPSVDALRAFYRAHQLGDSGETLSRYISFGLVAGPAPQFPFQLGRDQLPADVLSIDGFQDVLANFYRDARLSEKWWSIEPERAHEVELAEPGVRRIVLVTSAYLREVIKPVGNRTFTIYLEPLVGEETNFRNYGDHYYLVSGRASTLPMDQVRHAYLHFLLDTLPLRDRKLVAQKDALLRIAASAPRLPVEYQNDFIGLFDECLIKAVELRLDKPSPEKLEAALHENDADGFILVRPIVAQLQKFEKSMPAMDLYFPDLVAGINVAAEQKRLQNFSFNPAETAPLVKEQAPPPVQVSDLDAMLTEGDRLIAAQNGPAAAAVFQRVLKQSPGEPRAVYGLAIASILTGDGETAKSLFERLVEDDGPQSGSHSTAPIDPSILAWAHVYLGRIHDLEGDRELAVKEYQAAINISGAPPGAIAAARQGAQRSYLPPQGGDGSNGDAGTQQP
jgi:tetratricopeptide (TPR) repeat protein